MYLHQFPGVTIGSGQTLTVRQNTAAAIQAAINACATNGWDLVIAPGVYEIDVAAGITINGGQGSFAMRGTRASTFIQFHGNAPCLTLGDTSSFTGYSEYVIVDGLWLQYGASQTGNTAANLLVVGSLRDSLVNNLIIGANGTSYTAPNTPYLFPAYKAVLFTGVASEFSNIFSNIHVQGAQFRAVSLEVLGTGSLFDNWYITNGYLNQPGQITDCAFFMTGGNDSVFRQINVESFACNNIVNAQSVGGTLFQSWHFESIQPIGANPTWWVSAESRCTFQAMNFTGFWLTASLNTLTTSGTLSLFSTFGDDDLLFDSLYLNTQNAGNTVTLPIQLFHVNRVNGLEASIKARNIILDDSVSSGLVAHVSVDANSPLANFAGFNHIGEYQYSSLVSKFTKAQRSVSATYTVYGQDTDVDIVVPATITSCTVTLHRMQSPSGNGATTPTRVNNMVTFHRQTGSLSGTLTIADSTSGTLATNTTAGDLSFASSASTGGYAQVT